MKRVIASSMVHVVCRCKIDGHLRYREFNINVDEPLTPEILQYEIRPRLIEATGDKNVVVLSWQRYEM